MAEGIKSIFLPCNAEYWVASSLLDLPVGGRLGGESNCPRAAECEGWWPGQRGAASALRLSTIMPVDSWCPRFGCERKFRCVVRSTHARAHSHLRRRSPQMRRDEKELPSRGEEPSQQLARVVHRWHLAARDLEDGRSTRVGESSAASDGPGRTEGSSSQCGHVLQSQLGATTPSRFP